MKGAVVLAGAGGHKVGNAHIDPHYWSIGVGVHRHALIIGEGQPPSILALVERYAGVELPHLPCLWVDDLFFVIRCQLDRDKQLFAKIEGADLESVAKGGVVRGFEYDDVGIRLDAGLAKRGNVPLLPGRFLRTFFQGALSLLLMRVQ